MKPIGEQFSDLKEKHEMLYRAALRLVALHADDADDPEEMALRIADLAIASGLSSPAEASQRLRIWGTPVRSSHGPDRIPAYEPGRRSR